MAIRDLFSKRQRVIRGEMPDVYQCKSIPNKLRVQIVHIIRDAVGQDKYGDKYVPAFYKDIHSTLCREYGMLTLKNYNENDDKAVLNYFLATEDYEQAIDIIELSFDLINWYVRGSDYRNNTMNRKCEPDDAIEELNTRFKEHGVGYQFESGQIIKVDSQFLHSEVVKPVLALLGSEKRFKGANEEFLKAHEHFRHGRHEECLVDALKAFESTMKVICEKQKWAYNQKDTAKKLIDICLKNGLIPAYLQTQFSSLQNLFESGVPTIRNKLGGHGRGKTNITVGESIASYALHLSASNIVFLARLEKENFGK